MAENTCLQKVWEDQYQYKTPKDKEKTLPHTYPLHSFTCYFLTLTTSLRNHQHLLHRQLPIFQWWCIERERRHLPLNTGVTAQLFNKSYHVTKTPPLKLLYKTVLGKYLAPSYVTSLNHSGVTPIHLRERSEGNLGHLYQEQWIQLLQVSVLGEKEQCIQTAEGYICFSFLIALIYTKHLSLFLIGKTSIFISNVCYWLLLITS